jgi:hypothetical protein
MVAWAIMNGGYLCLEQTFVYVVIEVFNNILSYCPSLKGYVRTMQQDEVAKCLVTFLT